MTYVVIYGRKPTPKILKETRGLIERCFAIKSIPLGLLEKLGTEEQKAYHSTEFKEQVVDTLDADGRFKAVTFDQSYSEALEFLEKIVST